MRFWPKRTKDEKTNDIYAALVELFFWFCVVCVGLLCVLATYYFQDQDWLMLVGVGLSAFGVYAVMQSLIGLVIEASIGMTIFLGLVGFAILGFTLVQGYWLLME